MAVPVQQQNAQETLTVLVEEKSFKLRLEEAEPLIKSAIENAAGIKLEELTAGMWFGARKDSRWATLEVTARALPTDDGTAVELRVEHKTNPAATTLFILGAVFGAMLIIPLVALIAYGTRANPEQQRNRLILTHKMWREISDAIGAPHRASYREPPRRAYPPAERNRIAVPEEEPEEAEPEDELTA